MFGESARLFLVAFLVHPWDNHCGFESQHWTVSRATYLMVHVFINCPRVIGFRCLQAAGWVNVTFRDYARFIYFQNRSSAVIAIGAATLADIFDPAVRGKKVAINIISFWPLTDFVSEDGDLLHCTSAWTGNFYLMQSESLQLPHLSRHRLLGLSLEVYWRRRSIGALSSGSFLLFLAWAFSPSSSSSETHSGASEALLIKTWLTSDVGQLLFRVQTKNNLLVMM